MDPLAQSCATSTPLSNTSQAVVTQIVSESCAAVKSSCHSLTQELVKEADLMSKYSEKIEIYN